MKYFNYSSLDTRCSPIFGGSCSFSISAGAFCFYVNNSPALRYVSHGRRLMFL